jgi:hypothetical protein
MAAVPNDPAAIVAFLETHAGKILELLAQPHGIDQGTYDAALAEWQGAVILKDSAAPFQHYQSMRETANALVYNRDAILEGIAKLRQTDPEAASTAARSLEPLLNESTRAISLAQDTESVMNELTNTGAAQRLAGVVLTPQGRTSAGLVSNQLAAQRMALLPRGVEQAGWVQSIMARIRAVPITPQEVRQRAVELSTRVSAFAAAVRAALTGARAAAPGVLNLLLVWLTQFGSRLTTPIILIGDPFGTAKGAWEY